MRILYNIDSKKIDYNGILVLNSDLHYAWLTDSNQYGCAVIGEIHKTLKRRYAVLGPLTKFETRFFIKVKNLELLMNNFKTYSDAEKLILFLEKHEVIISPRQIETIQCPF